MSALKYKLEALLFSSARSMKVDELANLTKATPEEVREKLEEIKKDYEQRDSSIILIDEGTSFKLNVKSEHASSINQVVTETELSKTLMETLAIIAFKYPIKQSDLIKLRTNKAYDHLRELEDMGYIIRQKYGRTKLIKLTPKFFEYFDLPAEKLKEKFQDFGGIATAIKEKEDEVKQMNEEIKRKAKEAGKENKEGKEVDLVDEEGNKQKLDVYEETQAEQEIEESKEVKPYTEKIGNLEVTDVPEKEESEESEDVEGIPLTEEMGEEVIEKIKEEIEGEEGKKEEPRSEKTSKEVEEDVDKRVEELLHPKEESTEEKEEEPEETSEETSEGQTEDKEETSEEPPKQESTGDSEEEPKDPLDSVEEEGNEEENKQQ